MIKAIAILLDNYSTVYFLAVAIKTHYKKDRYLSKLACSLISLMNERAKPALDDRSIERFIDSQNPDDESGNGEYVQQESSPIFYTMLLWHRAFTDYVFNDSWRFLLQNDPYFGPGTFGQCARFMAERAAVIKQRLDDLRAGEHEDGWKDIPAFAKYLEAAMGVPEATENPNYVNRNFFLKELPAEFIRLFEEKIKIHIYDTWLSSDLVWYMIGGDPVLAKVFCQMLVHHKSEMDRIAVNEDGEEVNNTIAPFVYPSNIPATRMLGEHHTMFEEEADPIVMDVKKTMDWITSTIDFSKVLKKRFITKRWALIEKLALAEGVVNLWERKLDGACYLACCLLLIISCFAH